MCIRDRRPPELFQATAIPEEEDVIHEPLLLLGRVLRGTGLLPPKGEHPRIQLHLFESPSSIPSYEVAGAWYHITRGIPKGHLL